MFSFLMTLRKPDFFFVNVITLISIVLYTAISFYPHHHHQHVLGIRNFTQLSTDLNSREKFEPGPGFEPQTSRSLAWHSTTWTILAQLMDGTGLNLSLESNAMAIHCGLWHYLSSFDQGTNFLFIYSDIF